MATAEDAKSRYGIKETYIVPKHTLEGSPINEEIKKEDKSPPKVQKTGKRSKKDTAATLPVDEPVLIPVELDGSFGHVDMKVKRVISTTDLLILITDQNIGFSYTPPVSEDVITIKYRNSVTKVCYAGITYSIPEDNVKHTIFIKG